MGDPDLESIVILGAGPIGIEAALYARFLGYPTRVLEKGPGIATHVQRWKHVELFTPFGMNSSALGRACLKAHENIGKIPGDDERITGERWISDYLQPLAESDLLRKSIRFNQSVKYVGRSTMKSTDGIGEPQKRADDDFRILIENEKGEFWVPAEIVIDTTGTFGNANFLGPGSMPALGELSLRREMQVGIDSAECFLENGFTFELPDFSNIKNQLSNRKILVLGRGYSAATNLLKLAELSVEHNLDIDWATTFREQGENPAQPMFRIENDSLPARDRLANRANDCVQSGKVNWRRDVWIEKIVPGSERKFEVSMIRLSNDQTEYEPAGSEQYDFVVANPGFRADTELYSPLQVHSCYATGGPMKQAAALLGQSENDCTAIEMTDSETIVTSEPNFFVLGSKSYGQNSQFLFANGLQQIRQAFAKIVGRDELDLYRNMMSNS